MVRVFAYYLGVYVTPRKVQIMLATNGSWTGTTIETTLSTAEICERGHSAILKYFGAPPGTELPSVPDSTHGSIKFPVEFKESGTREGMMLWAGILNALERD